MRSSMDDLIKARDDSDGDGGTWVWLANGLIHSLQDAFNHPEPLRHYQAAAAFNEEVEKARRQL